MLRKLAAPVWTGAASACLRPQSSMGSVDRTSSALNAVATVCAFRQGAHSIANSLCTSQRFYFCASRVSLEGTAQPSASSVDGAAANESALDVAMRVNKLKKVHQTGGAGSNKAEVEKEAWQALNSLTEDQINNAEGKAVSLLLNSWAYFAKFWAKGKDGPL